MNKLIYIFLFLFFVSNRVCAQQPSPEAMAKIDSMKKELSRSNIEDTSKIKMLYLIGQETWIFRESYWDSIVDMSREAITKSDNEKVVNSLRTTMAGSLNSLGFIKKYKGNINEALNYYNLSLKEFQHLEESNEKAAVLNNIGRIYLSQGDFEKGLEYFHQSLRIVEDLNDLQGLSMALNNMGMIYFDQGEKEKAVEYLKKSIGIRKKINDNKGLAESYHNMGYVFSNYNQLDSAEIYLSKGLDIRRDIDDKRGVSESLKSLGSIYIINGNIEKAKEYLNKALEVKNAIDDKEGVTYLLIAITDLKIKENNISEAYKIANDNLKISKELGYPECIRNAAEKLYELNEITNKPKEALEMYKLYIQMRDSINNEETQKATIRQQTQYEFEKEQIRKENEAKEQARIEAEELKRRNNLQYSLIFLGILLLFGVVLSMGFIKVSPNVAEGLIFFSFLILFEFILVFAEPYINEYTDGEPIYNLLANAAIALIIFPLHDKLETVLKKRIVKS